MSLFRPRDRSSEARDFEHFSGAATAGQGLKRRSIRSALVSASVAALDLVLRVVSIAILARLLAPEQFGLVAMVAALTAIIDGFRDFGLGSATLQRPQVTHEVVSNLFWVNAAGGAGFTLAFWTAAPLIATYYNEPRLVMITVVLSLTFMLGGVSIQHEALLGRQLKQGELAVIRSFANVASVVAAIALALAEWGYWALVVREVLRIGLITAIVWIRCPWIPGWPTRGVGTRRMLHFGSDLTVTNLLVGVIGNLDRILIGKYFGAAILGSYRQAQQLVMIPVDHLNQPIANVSQPALSSLHAQPDRYRRYYEKIVLLVALTTLPLGIFIALYAYEITLLLLGPAWIDATVFVQIFGIAAAIRPVTGTSVIVLLSRGRSRRYLVTAVVHSLVLLGFMLIGLRWGATGIALAQVVTTVLVLWPKLYYSFSGTPVSVGSFFSAVRTSMVASTGMTIGLIALREAVGSVAPFAQLAVGVAFGALLYIACWWGQPRGRDEGRTLLRDVRSALARPT